MKNDVYALLYAKGTETGKHHEEDEERKKKKARRLIFGLGLPLLLVIGYQYFPSKLKREVTAEDKAAVKKAADAEKLEKFCANAELYGEGGAPGLLEKALLSERPENAEAKDADAITGLVKSGADVLAYHSVGRMSDGKVAGYDKERFEFFSRTVRAVTRNPDEFRADLDRSMRKGRGTVVALVGSGREHYNILPDGSADPDCSAGILDRFVNAHPGYSDKLKVVFFHPYTQEALFGQPEYEARKFAEISRRGWTNAFLGIDLGKDDLAKPLVTEDGWRNGAFWAEGPGIANFSGKEIALEKALTASRLRRAGKGSVVSDFYWLPWGAAPKDAGAARELARSYSLIFAGYVGGKSGGTSRRIIQAKVMGDR